jgi:hypothetical protein
MPTPSVSLGVDQLLLQSHSLYGGNPYVRSVEHRDSRGNLEPHTVSVHLIDDSSKAAL